MYTRKEIEEMVNVHVNIDGMRHISDMLEEIQSHLLFKSPACNFVKLCSKEDWKGAEFVSDTMNKEILKDTPVFKEFVKLVKKSPEYILNIRKDKLNIIFEK